MCRRRRRLRRWPRTSPRPSEGPVSCGLLVAQPPDRFPRSGSRRRMRAEEEGRAREGRGEAAGRIDVTAVQGTTLDEAIRSTGVAEVTSHRWGDEFGGRELDAAAASRTGREEEAGRQELAARGAPRAEEATGARPAVDRAFVSGPGGPTTPSPAISWKIAPMTGGRSGTSCVACEIRYEALAVRTPRRLGCSATIRVRAARRSG